MIDIWVHPKGTTFFGQHSAIYNQSVLFGIRPSPGHEIAMSVSLSTYEKNVNGLVAAGYKRQLEEVHSKRKRKK
jgi:hypothetical protein